jgi:hypothetical protein
MGAKLNLSNSELNSHRSNHFFRQSFKVLRREQQVGDANIVCNEKAKLNSTASILNGFTKGNWINSFFLPDEQRVQGPTQAPPVGQPNRGTASEQK